MVEYKDVVLERLEDAVEDAKRHPRHPHGVVDVVAAGSTFYAEPCMGDLVTLGYMTKKYVPALGGCGEVDILWTLHKDAGFTVDNGHEVIAPGETVVWEK